MAESITHVSNDTSQSHVNGTVGTGHEQPPPPCLTKEALAKLVGELEQSWKNSFPSSPSEGLSVESVLKLTQIMTQWSDIILSRLQPTGITDGGSEARKALSCLKTAVVSVWREIKPSPFTTSNAEIGTAVTALLSVSGKAVSSAGVLLDLVAGESSEGVIEAMETLLELVQLPGVNAGLLSTCWKAVGSLSERHSDVVGRDDGGVLNKCVNVLLDHMEASVGQVRAAVVNAIQANPNGDCAPLARRLKLGRFYLHHLTVIASLGRGWGDREVRRASQAAAQHLLLPQEGLGPSPAATSGVAQLAEALTGSWMTLLSKLLTACDTKGFEFILNALGGVGQELKGLEALGRLMVLVPLLCAGSSFPPAVRRWMWVDAGIPLCILKLVEACSDWIIAMPPDQGRVVVSAGLCAVGGTILTRDGDEAEKAVFLQWMISDCLSTHPLVSQIGGDVWRYVIGHCFSGKSQGELLKALFGAWLELDPQTSLGESVAGLLGSLYPCVKDIQEGDSVYRSFIEGLARAIGGGSPPASSLAGMRLQALWAWMPAPKDVSPALRQSVVVGLLLPRIAGVLEGFAGSAGSEGLDADAMCPLYAGLGLVKSLTYGMIEEMSPMLLTSILSSIVTLLGIPSLLVGDGGMGILVGGLEAAQVLVQAIDAATLDRVLTSLAVVVEHQPMADPAVAKFLGCVGVVAHVEGTGAHQRLAALFSRLLGSERWLVRAAAMEAFLSFAKTTTISSLSGFVPEKALSDLKGLMQGQLPPELSQVSGLDLAAAAGVDQGLLSAVSKKRAAEALTSVEERAGKRSRVVEGALSGALTQLVSLERAVSGGGVEAEDLALVSESVRKVLEAASRVAGTVSKRLNEMQ